MRWLAALALLSTASGAALAQGDSQDPPTVALPIFAAEPLESLGENALRFWKRPSLGGPGYMVEMVYVPDDRAQARVVELTGYWRGHTRVSERTFDLPPGDYLAIARMMDLGMEQDGFWPDDPMEVAVCGDGPGFLAERYSHGKLHTLAGSCKSNHPNTIISLVIEGTIFRSANLRW